MNQPQPKPQRHRDLATIHVAAKQLALSREDYEAMLWTVGRVRSAGDLDSAGRRRVIEHLKSRGFKTRRAGRSQPSGPRDLLVRKIRALLINSPGGRKPDAYADGIAKRMFSVERFEWCQPDQLRRIVQALEVEKRRKS